MADRTADNADLAVDELRRRARRRLVGAIVLALAAAVILPLLLEKDPKPLGDDVSVQIPPVDEGRFVNRLTGRSGESKSASKPDAKALPKNLAPKVDVAPTAAPSPAPLTAAPAPPVAESTPVQTPAMTNVAAPKKSVSEAEQRVLGTKSGAKADAMAAPEAKADVKADAKVTVVAAAAPAANQAPPAAGPVAPVAPVAPPPAKAETFAVQIAAFTDDKGASALAGKLKRAGYASTYTEPVETSRGTLWRVRVGGFATRTDAEAVRAKLKTEGWNGLVVAAK